MTLLAGRTIGLVGGLSGLPRRIAARDVAARGGTLVRGVTRRAAVRGVRADAARPGRRSAAIVARVAAARAPGRELRSENGFRRLLAGGAAEAGLARQELIDRSRLAAADFDLLALFDGFEHDVEPFSFRDLILARKYAGLISGGAGWAAIARSVHRFGPAVSLTAKSLQVGSDRAIYASHDDGLCELDGQMLLGLGAGGEIDPEEIFARAEAAEAAGAHAEAAALFERCLAIDPGDAVAAFNRGNCLRAAGRAGEAELALARALSLDPGFVEAWFNLAGLVAARGRVDAARQHLQTGDRARSGLCRRGVQPRVARVRGGRSRRGAAVVGALSRARRRQRVGAHGGAGTAVPRSAGGAGRRRLR